MALITRCPVCGTRFKVVPDQLRISDGWVRCGECGEVFDASADLSQGEVPANPPTSGSAFTPVPPPAPAPAPANAPAPWPPIPVDPSEARLEWDAEAGFAEPRRSAQTARYGEGADGADSLSIAALLHDRQDDGDPASPPAVLPVLRDADAPGRSPGPAWLRAGDDAAPEANEAAADGSAAAEQQDRVDPGSQPEPDAAAGQGTGEKREADGTGDDAAEEIEDSDEAEAEATEDAEDSEDSEEEVAQALAAFPADLSTLPESSVYLPPPPRAEVDAALAGEQPSFLNADRAPEQDAVQRPWLRRGMLALAVLLVLLLAGQMAVQQRDQLAAQMPAARPLLQALCAPLGCTVQPLRHIESIVIDNSTFTTLRHGVYRLNLVLKNRGATALAVPAIELALTDTQEQPVLRRVLQPVDMAGASGNISPIAPDGEWTASMELSVADEALIGRIVGYRLLAFYP